MESIALSISKLLLVLSLKKRSQSFLAEKYEKAVLSFSSVSSDKSLLDSKKALFLVRSRKK